MGLTLSDSSHTVRHCGSCRTQWDTVARVRHCGSWDTVARETLWFVRHCGSCLTQWDTVAHETLWLVRHCGSTQWDKCVAVCCSVLQCFAVCCSDLLWLYTVRHYGSSETLWLVSTQWDTVARGHSETLWLVSTQLGHCGTSVSLCPTRHVCLARANGAMGWLWLVGSIKL